MTLRGEELDPPREGLREAGASGLCVQGARAGHCHCPEDKEGAPPRK